MKPTADAVFTFAVLVIGLILFVFGLIFYYIFGGGFGAFAVALLIIAAMGVWLAIWTYKDKIIPPIRR